MGMKRASYYKRIKKIVLDRIKDGTYTKSELARLYGVSRDTIYEWSKALLEKR